METTKILFKRLEELKNKQNAIIKDLEENRDKYNYNELKHIDELLDVLWGRISELVFIIRLIENI